MASVVFVTGAGRGIGRAIAQRLARTGARIGVTDLDAESAAAVADEIRNDGRSRRERTAPT